ncbi:unnamed protein product [Jaminaea pallidilutea]
MRPVADIAQRATVTGLVGLGAWGIWLTAAVWKSRRGDQAMPIDKAPGVGPLPGQHPTHRDQKEHVV